jgi:hypothetical protein
LHPHRTPAADVGDEHGKGDRVHLTMSGEFLPYKAVLSSGAAVRVESENEDHKSMVSSITAWRLAVTFLSAVPQSCVNSQRPVMAA